MSAHESLPRSAGHPLPVAVHAARAAPDLGLAARRRYVVRVHGTDLVPVAGAVLFAANHVGVIDGPLLAIYAPRPVHVFTKVEMFRGGAGALPHLLRPDPARPVQHRPARGAPDAPGAARRRGRRDLPRGEPGQRRASDRFHRGAAYFALAVGRPSYPSMMFGTREPGGRSGSLPRKGATIDIVFGAPYTVPAVEWPRTKEQVEHTSMLLREHLLVHLDHAKALTGREPARRRCRPDDHDPDPATGVTDQGAP